MIDLRNWDLIQEIGGKRKLTKDITELGGRPIVDNWVKIMGRFWLVVGEFINNGQVLDLEFEGLVSILSLLQGNQSSHMLMLDLGSFIRSRASLS